MAFTDYHQRVTRRGRQLQLITGRASVLFLVPALLLVACAGAALSAPGGPSPDGAQPRVVSLERTVTDELPQSSVLAMPGGPHRLRLGPPGDGESLVLRGDEPRRPGHRPRLFRPPRG